MLTPTVEDRLGATDVLRRLPHFDCRQNKRTDDALNDPALLTPTCRIKHILGARVPPGAAGVGHEAARHTGCFDRVIATVPPAKPLLGGDSRQSPLRDHAWRTFAWTAILAAAALGLFAASVGFKAGGGRVTPAIDDIGLAGFEFVSAICCVVAVNRSSHKYKLPWALLGAAATSVAVSQLVWSWEDLGLGVTPLLTIGAHLGGLIAVPLSIAAGLAFPSAPGRATTRWRALVDGAIMVVALILIGWVIGLARIYTGPTASPPSEAVALVNMGGQAIMLTVLVMAIRRAGRSLRYRLSLLTFAVTVNLTTITVFTYLASFHRASPNDRVLDTAFAFAYLALALAALWPEREGGLVAEEGSASTWEVALPPIAVGVAVLAVLGLRVSNGPLDSPIPWTLAAVLIALLTATQMLTYRDSLGLLRASKRAEALLSQVVSHTPAGLARIGMNLRIVDANPRMGMLLYAPSQVLVGSALAEYLPTEDLVKAIEKFQPFDSSLTDTVESDSELRRADGSNVWVHWSITAVRKAKSGIDYFLGFFEDVDAQHQAAQAAIANLTGLERLSRLKSEFTSMVSHEFRTALTGIQGLAELMRGSDMEPSDVKAVSNDIFNEAQRINRLINDMLDVDRMESGRMTFRLGPVDLNATIADTVERAKTTTSKHHLTTILDPAVTSIPADSDRLVQVLSNLLSNAIKYSPDGGEVVVRSWKRDREVEVSVGDHGKGIPADFIDRLFERFERYEDNQTARTIGTGLGLAITRRIVEGHGGRIWVESKVGVGSEFHFALPEHGPQIVTQATPATSLPAGPTRAGSNPAPS